MPFLSSPLCRFGLLLLASRAAFAFEPFKVEEIRVEGLQRIAVGTVYNYLPVRQGDLLTEAQSDAALRALFRTGFFEDAVLEREGNTLVVFVQERPAIASIEINGNEDIPSEQLREALKQIGLAEGRVFDRSMLDRIEQELKQQYLARGKYSARIESTVTPQERNRVAIRIDIGEGEVASIKQINIVGNRAFEEGDLLDEFELGTKPFFSWFSDRHKYAKQRLSADLERLRSYYQDRGYLQFNVESTQVSITPDRQDVYITVNIHEGERYTVGEIKVAGETVLPEAAVRELIAIKSGEIFSRSRVTGSASAISERLGDEGYAFANVNPIPEVDEQRQVVDLTFFIDPGKLVYVRRVNVSGNLKTQDEVIRREVRQMEAAPVSTAQVTRSRTRIDRLGYFEQVNVETPPVPGTPDLIDVNFTVVERPTFGSINLGIGYSDAQGLLVTAGITQDNFLGSGRKVSAEINNSAVNTVYSVSYTNPYYTESGVSRTLRAWSRATDASEANLSDYTTDTYGVGVGFGVPTGEFTSLRFGVDAASTTLNLTDSVSDEFRGFCTENADPDDCSFLTATLNASWAHDTRNKTLFATRGGLTSLSSEVAVPAGDNSISFYKVRANHRRYLGLTDWLTLGANAELAYGDALGSTTELPPFENFYAGGSRTVRGYASNSLGPLDSNGDPLGGNARVIGGLELIFPMPFSEKSASTRLSAFLDAGNVYNTHIEDVDIDELRYSVGLSLIWLTPIGPMSFSIANAINPQDGDKTESFQFTLGTL